MIYETSKRKTPKGDRLTTVIIRTSREQRKEGPEGDLRLWAVFSMSCFLPSEINKNKTPKGNLWLDRFLNVTLPRESNKRQEPEGLLTVGPSLFLSTRAAEGKNPKGYLRIDRHCE